jgi:hypothetical protein
VHSFTPHSELILRIRPLCRQRHIVQLRLRSDDHPALAREAEVGGEPAEVDLAQQRAGLVPHVHAVAHAGVDVAVGVTVDSVRNAKGGVGEGLAVVEGAVFTDVVAVAVRSQRKFGVDWVQRGPDVYCFWGLGLE